jgi:hypothetical protein
VKAKIYPAEKVAEVAKALAEAPALPPKFLPHEEVISQLKKQIKELHQKKNYDAREITRILKEKGIRTTLKEVRSLLSDRAMK